MRGCDNTINPAIRIHVASNLAVQVGMEPSVGWCSARRRAPRRLDWFCWFQSVSMAMTMTMGFVRMEFPLRFCLHMLAYAVANQVICSWRRDWTPPLVNSISSRSTGRVDRPKVNLRAAVATTMLHRSGEWGEIIWRMWTHS